MDSERIARWREADRLFALWLEQEFDRREHWLTGEDVEPAVLSAVRRLIANHGAQKATLPSPDRLRAGLDEDPAPRNALAGRHVGDWELIEEIGRGGMSVVYRARRTGVDFDQIAAIKLLGLAAAGAQGSARFEQERRVLARLRHPQIAALIDGGFAADGTPFLAMALVDGSTLDAYCSARQLDWRARVQLVREACDAVAHAHRNLLVHRDLKPSNILVTTQGVPVLIDFGIAKLLDDGHPHTQAGMHAMTPGYAAPEQIHDRAITTATDVYALGVILRELCVAERALPQDLRNIIAMATREDAERRYPDARALGDDLARLLARRPVQATPDTMAYRMRAFLHRRRGLVLAAASVLLAVLAGVAATLWQARQASREAAEALHQAARANSARDFLFSLFAAGDRERSEELDPRVSTIIARGVAALREGRIDDPELHAEMALLLGHIDTTIGEYDRAAELLDAALASASQAGSVPLVGQVRARQGILANARGNPQEAVGHFEEAMRIAAATPGGADPGLVDGLSGWAYAMSNLGRGAEARDHIIALLADPRAGMRADRRGELGLTLATLTDDPRARLERLEAAQRDFTGGAPTPAVRMSLASELAKALMQSGRHAESVQYAREAAALADRMNPGTTSRRARAHNNLGSILSRAQRLVEAETAYATAETIYRELGDEHSPAFASLLHNRGVQLRDLGAPELGLPRIEQAWMLARRQFGADDRRTVIALRNLALARAEAHADPRAEMEWQESWAKSAALPALSRHDSLVVGAAIAVTLERAELALDRLAEADRLARDGGLQRSPVQGMRAATIKGTALSLGAQWRDAEAQFREAANLSASAGSEGRATSWRNALAFAEHWQRHADPTAANEQFAAALATLESIGVVPDSVLLRRLRAHASGRSGAGAGDVPGADAVSREDPTGT